MKTALIPLIAILAPLSAIAAPLENAGPHVLKKDHFACQNMLDYDDIRA